MSSSEVRAGRRWTPRNGIDPDILVAGRGTEFAGWCVTWSGGPKTRSAHVVPAGYQRFFAEGEQIRMVWKASRVEKVIGVKDNFVSKRLLIVRVGGVSG